MSETILITICARGGSKGFPSKNIAPLLGKPLIAHTIGQARSWRSRHGERPSKIVVSTDSEKIAEVAREYGAEVPFLRPPALASDTSGKVPVITHALRECEQRFGQRFEAVLDLDPTSPFRRQDDLDRAWDTFARTRPSVCFSVVKAKKSPYFNMVERAEDGRVRLVKSAGKPLLARQASPQVWDMNASIYVYSRDYLLSDPQSVWADRIEIFEMPAESVFDIDREVDLVVTEALMKYHGLGAEPR